MRKFRYGDPSQHGFFRKWSALFYFVVAWNAAALAAYFAYTNSKEKKDPHFKEKTSRQRYLEMIGFNTGYKEHTHIKIVGGKIVNITSDEQKQAD